MKIGYKKLGTKGASPLKSMKRLKWQMILVEGKNKKINLTPITYNAYKWTWGSGEDEENNQIDVETTKFWEKNKFREGNFYLLGTMCFLGDVEIEKWRFVDIFMCVLSSSSVHLDKVCWGIK